MYLRPLSGTPARLPSAPAGRDPPRDEHVRDVRGALRPVGSCRVGRRRRPRRAGGPRAGRSPSSAWAQVGSRQRRSRTAPDPEPMLEEIRGYAEAGFTHA